MIVSAICFLTIQSFVFLFFGWKMMHPLENKSVDITARRKMLVEQGLQIKQQILNQVLNHNSEQKPNESTKKTEWIDEKNRMNRWKKPNDSMNKTK